MPALPNDAEGLARPHRLGALLMMEMIERIVSGDFAAGDLLPRETDLQREFTVSRTALREGLKAVEDRGMIEIRQGRGAVVRPTRDWNLLDPWVLSALLDHHPTPEIYEQLNAVRMMVEPETARLAAASATDEHLTRMSELLKQMAGEQRDPEAFLEHDVQFHRVILDASGNLIVRAVMNKIEQPLRSSRRLTNTIPHSLQKAQAAHEAIHRCITDRDGDGAAAEMAEHLRWSGENLLRRWNKTRPARAKRRSG